MVSDKLVVILIIVAIILSVVSIIITISGMNIKSLPKPEINIVQGQSTDAQNGQISIIINPQAKQS